MVLKGNIKIIIVKIFRFGRVLLVMVLKGNIKIIIVKIFRFGRVLGSKNASF